MAPPVEVRRDDDVHKTRERKVHARRPGDGRIDRRHTLPHAQKAVLVDEEVDEQRNREDPVAHRIERRKEQCDEDGLGEVGVALGDRPRGAPEERVHLELRL